MCIFPARYKEDKPYHLYLIRCNKFAFFTEPRTTYTTLTVGLNYIPEVLKAIEGFVIRPEFKVDHSLNGTRPYNIGSGGVGRDKTSFIPKASRSECPNPHGNLLALTIRMGYENVISRYL